MIWLDCASSSLWTYTYEKLHRFDFDLVVFGQVITFLVNAQRTLDHGKKRDDILIQLRYNWYLVCLRLPSVTNPQWFEETTSSSSLTSSSSSVTTTETCGCCSSCLGWAMMIGVLADSIVQPCSTNMFFRFCWFVHLRPQIKPCLLPISFASPLCACRLRLWFFRGLSASTGGVSNSHPSIIPTIQFKRVGCPWSFEETTGPYFLHLLLSVGEECQAASLTCQGNLNGYQIGLEECKTRGWDSWPSFVVTSRSTPNYVHISIIIHI